MTVVEKVDKEALLEVALEKLPRWPGDDAGLPRPGAQAYIDRMNLVSDLTIRSAFEFGGHFGHGLVTWLVTFRSTITKVGWSDNEGAFEGSNAACEENLRAYAKEWLQPIAEMWHTEFPWKTGGRHYDLVMVDGDHAQQATLVDLSLAIAMRPKVLLVDDLQLGPVRAAVDDFAHYTGLRYEEAMNVAAGTAIFYP